MDIITALAGIKRRFIGGFRTRSHLAGRSKYMPRLGAKERARHAGKPDGLMHLTPHEHRAVFYPVATTLTRETLRKAGM